MKILMFEIEEFLKTLSEDWYIEDDGLLEGQYNEKGKLINGSNVINVAKNSIDICWQGEEDCFEDEYKDFLTEFNKWKKTQTCIYITLEIDKSNLDKVTEMFKTMPIKIISR
jgi:hypothetical protein